MNAKECEAYNLKRSEFLLMSKDGDDSWAGALYGHCQECSELDDKTFKRKVRQHWEARAKLMRGRKIRSRSITFDNQTEVIREMFKDMGLSNTKLRELTIIRTRAISAAFILGHANLKEEAQQAVYKICMEWQEAKEKMAADPSYTVSTDSRSLMASDTSYLTNVMAGINMSFICRAKGCLFFGMNDEKTWVQSRRGYQFRCPICGDQYHPWASKTDSVPAKYILSLTHPASGVLELIPTVWPPSEDEKWLNNMIEVTARDIQDQSDLDAWYNGSKLNLSQLIDAQKIPLHFGHMVLGENALYRIDKNSWNLEHQQQFGFHGAQFKDVEAVQTPYSNWNELIGIVANHVAASRAMLRRSSL